ncbi:MAG: hypothetical protein F6J93_06210 [Oscillatoria sp. SIO1A7]|nr:hypothetical protein [Oscillatoria sp. SIO1A7]
MTDKFNSFLNSLEIDPNSDPENHRLLERDKCFTLAWLSFYQEKRTYQKLMKDCKLESFERCEEIIQELIDLGILRSARSRSVRSAQSR